MSEVLILEFPAGTADQYDAVNKLLEANVEPGEDAMPAPLLTHVAASGDSGLIVVEVWESREAQAEFMKRLAPALAEVGVPEPSRTEWSTLIGRYSA